ncbi:MAG TPA: hypothetical protein VM120_13680 [Bryobacteraceae bacterium]|nr:hypothetical protein [Bryobacteraceae bacterium]
MNVLEAGLQDLRLEFTSVVVIAPDRKRNKILSDAFVRIGVKVRAEVRNYPDSLAAEALANGDCDAVVIDLDSNPAAALALVEIFCGRNLGPTAMVCSESADPELLVNCMRAGARELIRMPVTDEALVGAVVRAAARRGMQDRRSQRCAKTFVFRAAKGGAGASTMAANFAVALAQESKAKVALVDLNSELGDLSVLLNLAPRFSVLDAIRNPARLDWDFLSTLLIDHSSGVRLLPAPDGFAEAASWDRPEAIERVIWLLQEHFPYVVVDAGRNGHLSPGLLKGAEAIFLISQVDVPSLRNTQRLASYLSDQLGSRDQLRIVLNRYDAKKSSITPADIERALSFPVAVRIPNDFAAVSAAANTGTAVTSGDSPVGRTLRGMARAACDAKEQAPAGRTWSIFGRKTAAAAKTKN